MPIVVRKLTKKGYPKRKHGMRKHRGGAKTKKQITAAKRAAPKAPDGYIKEFDKELQKVTYLKSDDASDVLLWDETLNKFVPLSQRSLSPQRKTPSPPKVKTPSPPPRSPSPVAVRTIRSPTPSYAPPSKSPSPVAKSPSPVAKSPSPVAKTPSPVAKTTRKKKVIVPRRSTRTVKSPSPKTKSPSPVAKSPSPVAKSPSPKAKTPSPVAKSPSPDKPQSPPGSPVLSVHESTVTVTCEDDVCKMVTSAPGSPEETVTQVFHPSHVVHHAAQQAAHEAAHAQHVAHQTFKATQAPKVTAAQLQHAEKLLETAKTHLTHTENTLKRGDTVKGDEHGIKTLHTVSVAHQTLAETQPHSQADVNKKESLAHHLNDVVHSIDLLKQQKLAQDAHEHTSAAEQIHEIIVDQLRQGNTLESQNHAGAVAHVHIQNAKEKMSAMAHTPKWDSTHHKQTATNIAGRLNTVETSLKSLKQQHTEALAGALSQFQEELTQRGDKAVKEPTYESLKQSIKERVAGHFQSLNPKK